MFGSLLGCHGRHSHHWRMMMLATSTAILMPAASASASSSHDRVSSCEKEDGGNTNTNSTGGSSSSMEECYEYVVIGYGRAGKEAYPVLLSSSSSKVGIVDPHYNGNICYGIHGNTIQIVNQHTHKISKIQFTKGVLVSTGVTGATPPSDCIDPSLSPHKLITTNTTNTSTNSSTFHPTTTTVKKHTNDSSHDNDNDDTNGSSSSGGVVVVLGTSIKAMNQVLELLNPQQQQKTKTNQNTKKKKKKKNNNTNASVVWMYGVSGPLSYMVPKYLSIAIAQHWEKKLYKHHNHHHPPPLKIYSRTLLRYLTNQQIYMTPWMDTMDTIVLPSYNTIYYLPFTHGPSGMASVLPFTTTTTTTQTPPIPWNHVITNHTPTSNNNNNNNSNTSSPITCTYPDGRILVNSNYMASNNIYAAGSVAVVPHWLDGWKKASSGKQAAHAMLEKKKKKKNHYLIENDKESSTIQVTHSPSHWKTQAGIQFTSVGNTSTDHCVIHAFWWTNTQLQRRNTNNNIINNNNHPPPPPNNTMVYGQGCLFYLHATTGQLVGILTWGIPTTSTSIQYMKKLLFTNATCLLLQPQQPQQQQPPDVLQPHHLQTATQTILQLSYNSSSSSSASDQSHNNVPNHFQNYRPLYKYTTPSSSQQQQQQQQQQQHSNHSSPLFLNPSKQQQQQRPPSLQYFPQDYYPPTSTSINTTKIHPKKEEPLWLSSPTLYQNQKAYQRYQMYQNLRQGQFANHVDPMTYSTS